MREESRADQSRAEQREEAVDTGARVRLIAPVSCSRRSRIAGRRQVAHVFVSVLARVRVRLRDRHRHRAGRGRHRVRRCRKPGRRVAAIARNR